MSEFTKGPWKYGMYKENYGFGFYVKPVDNLISDVAQVDLYQSTSRSKDEHEANARLIAAAPEMYEALVHIAEYWNRDNNEVAMVDALWHIIETAESVLAKAKGESND